MPNDRRLFIGPRLRRLRRELGLTQADMASDIDVSPSYVALMERNHRPLSLEVLLRLARAYKIDIGDLARDGAADFAARLQAALKNPIFADLEISGLDATDVAANFPGVAEAMLRLHSAHLEAQLALADRGASEPGAAGRSSDGLDPSVEARRFLAARRNSFPTLDEAGERLGERVAASQGFADYLQSRHSLRLRFLPPMVMAGSVRRLDWHKKELRLDESLDAAGRNFQIALQLAYLELEAETAAVMRGGVFDSEAGERLTRRALANYAAAAVLMPYSNFAKAAEARRYDIEALAHQFGVSFEQTAHRLTTLQKPGQERVPFFFIRVDPAGNVSKRLDGAGFPFAQHGGGCPLWSVHQVFQTPGRIVTQWLELPDGQRFFSIARTVTGGGGAFGAPRVERAVALGCAAEHADRLIYTQEKPAPAPGGATPIGVTCRLCQRIECMARSAPPIGRQILPDDFRRTAAPFGFSD